MRRSISRIKLDQIENHGTRPAECLPSEYFCESQRHKADAEGMFKYIICPAAVHKFPEYEGRILSPVELALEKEATDVTYCCDDQCFFKVASEGYLVGRVPVHLCISS